MLYNEINEKKVSIINKNNQIFKDYIPLYFIYDFLEKNTNDTNDFIFIFNKETYKRSKLNNSLTHFLETIKPFYYMSKTKYIDNCNNYKKLTTIIRQICKYHNIDYNSKVKYYTSNYENQYVISFTKQQIQNIRYYARTNNIDSSCSSIE